MVTKQLNIKNRTYYSWNDLTNLKDFDPKLLKLDKKSSMNVNLYYIGYVTKNSECNINSVILLYLLIGELDGFIEEKEGSKYLNNSLTYSNSDVLIKYAEVWSGIKEQIKKINDGQIGECGKDYMKIKFDSDNSIPLNKILKFRILTIIMGNVFEKDDKYYPQIFLDDCLYEIQMLEYDRIDISEGADVNKSKMINQKNVIFATTGIF